MFLCDNKSLSPQRAGCEFLCTPECWLVLWKRKKLINRKPTFWSDTFVSCVAVRPCPHLSSRIRSGQSDGASYDRSCACASVRTCLCALVHLARRCLGGGGVTASSCPDCQLVSSLHNVPFDLVLATTLAECTSDTLPSFVVQSCGSHFIYWAFNFSQYGGWGSKSVFNQPATSPSPKQNQLWCPAKRSLNRRLN